MTLPKDVLINENESYLTEEVLTRQNEAYGIHMNGQNSTIPMPDDDYDTIACDQFSIVTSPNEAYGVHLHVTI